jgi:hypothetical protein
VKALYLVFFYLISSLCWGQKPGAPDPELAAEHFSHGNYMMAQPIYMQLIKQEPNNYLYNYRTGICLLKINTPKKKEAIPYFEFCTKQTKFDQDVWLYLGHAYHIAMRLDDAIKSYENYKTKGTKEGIIEADLGIQQCKNAKLLVKHPLNVTFMPLGKEVNSEFPDYHPYVTQDEQMLVFTSRRKGNVGAVQVEVDGYYPSDIWYSKSSNGVFQKAKSAGPAVNGNFDEICVGLSADGNWMSVYVDDIKSAGDIYFSNYNRSWQKPTKLEGLNDNVNEGFESSGCLSPDGLTYYFASRRDGSLGGRDLYIARKLPNGKWSKAQNMGTVLNSQYDEDFPYMAPDGKTLYFSSQGHNSMGGFDLFMSTYNEEDGTWSIPRNIGYPLNTTDDDMSICFTEANRVAYIASAREGGLGDLDIWRVVFDEVQQNTFTLITGKIIPPDNSVNVSNVSISLSSAETNERVGTYKPNPASGNYVIALPPGKYIMTIDAPGCKPLIETLIVFDIGPQGVMSKDIVLLK